MDSFPESEGFYSCTEHYYCNACVVETVHRSRKKNDEFPASCCARSRSGMSRAAYELLLGRDFIVEYRAKMLEHFTPHKLRLYCGNAQCAKFQYPKTFDTTDYRRTLARYGCGTVTCVGCKGSWMEGHFCPQSNSKPTWWPPYTKDCQIKQCPECKDWLMLFEACITWYVDHATTSSASSVWRSGTASTSTSAVRHTAIHPRGTIRKASNS
jgi:hypothetical protein